MKTIRLFTDLAIKSIVSVARYTKKKIDKAFCKTNSIVLQIQITEQAKVLLNGISNFSVFSGSAVSNTGKTKITGDCGVSPDSSIGGFPPGILLGTFHLNDAIAIQAKHDLVSAYKNVAERNCSDRVELFGNIGGLTLTPGLYYSSSTLDISFCDLTFDAHGNSNAVFIIQIASDLIIKSGCRIILKGKAFASNIFWQVGNSATFETASAFKGTVLAMQTIIFFKGAKLDGRALTIDGAIFLTGNNIVRS